MSQTPLYLRLSIPALAFSAALAAWQVLADSEPACDGEPCETAALSER